MGAVGFTFPLLSYPTGAAEAGRQGIEASSAAGEAAWGCPGIARSPCRSTTYAHPRVPRSPSGAALERGRKLQQARGAGHSIFIRPSAHELLDLVVSKVGPTAYGW